MLATGTINGYAIGGAIGASFYIEAVSTQDIDIFAHLTRLPPAFEELSAIYSYLREKGYLPRNEFVVIEDWDVQFLIPSEGSLEAEAVKNANIIEFYDERVHVMMPEYLVAIALATGRDKDISRVREFIKENKVNLDELEILVERFKLEDRWQRVRQPQ